MKTEHTQKLEKALNCIKAILRRKDIDAISYQCALTAEELLTEVLEKER